LKATSYAVLATVALASCQLLIGLEPRTLQLPDGGEEIIEDDAGAGDAGKPDAGAADGGCQRQADCDSPDAAVVCVASTGKCVQLTSPDCKEIYGADYHNDKAVLFSTMFTLQGGQASTNAARVTSVKLAVSEINMYGGVPGPNGKRPITLLVCDETNLANAGSHLINDLRVSNIIGPNTSPNVITLSNELGAPKGTVLMTPAGLAGAITSLDDKDFTFRTVPSDVQRGPLMVRRINDIENELRDAGVYPVKLAIVARIDILGAGTSLILNQLLQVNDAGLTAVSNANNVKVKLYDNTAPNQTPIVNDVLGFSPDIIVGVGSGEIVTQIIAPLEAGFSGSRRPVYVFADSSKGPDILALAATDAGVRNGLRERVSGTGFSPVPESVANNSNFEFNYRAFTNGPYPNASAMTSSHDAVYAIAFALAAFKNDPVTGATIVKGLRRLGSGGQRFNTGPSMLQNAFTALDVGSAITIQGNTGPLEFDSNGDVIGSQIEIWCISRDQTTGALSYRNSGQTYNTKTGAFVGAYTPCP
jgi:branched-chain amino acid transport system substrate-binding protein